jgi:hypothetical protein
MAALGVPECALHLAVDELPAAVAECMARARANAPHSSTTMGPLDGAFLARLAAGMLLWEALFQLVRSVAARRARLPPGAPRDEVQFWHGEVPSFAVSTLHALCMVWRGALHVASLWHAPLAEKMLIMPGGAFYGANQAVELSNWCVSIACRVSRPLRRVRCVCAACARRGGVCARGACAEAAAAARHRSRAARAAARATSSAHPSAPGGCLRVPTVARVRVCPRCAAGSS